MLFLSSLDSLLQDAYIIFQKGVDNFEIENKTCKFLIRGVQWRYQHENLGGPWGKKIF